jgi:hypothetical protein
MNAHLLTKDRQTDGYMDEWRLDQRHILKGLAAVGAAVEQRLEDGLLEGHRLGGDLLEDDQMEARRVLLAAVQRAV